MPTELRRFQPVPRRQTKAVHKKTKLCGWCALHGQSRTHSRVLREQLMPRSPGVYVNRRIAETDSVDTCIQTRYYYYYYSYYYEIALVTINYILLVKFRKTNDYFS